MPLPKPSPVRSKTAWFRAAQSWNYREVDSALRDTPELLVGTNPKGLNALHLACAVRPGTPGVHEQYGIQTVTALLTAGMDVESVAFRDDDGSDWCANAVWFAVSRGQNLPLVRFLLERGGDPTYSLFAVLWGYKPEFARELVKYQPRMNVRDGHGRTALHAAVNPHRLEVLTLYLDAGADPSIKDCEGVTPLGLAKKRRLPREIIERMQVLSCR